MMRLFQRTSFATFILISLIYLATWILTTWNDWTFAGQTHYLKGIGTAAGILGYFLFSLSLLLSSRWPKIENCLGGLDQIYRIHHRLGIWGLVMIFLHPWIIALKWLPYQWDHFLLFVFPIHGRFSINIGSIALLLMLILIGLTISKILFYQQWKLSHKFLSLVFLLSTIHIILAEKKFGSSELSHLMLLIPMGIGLFGIMYKQLYIPLLKSLPVLHVIKANLINDEVVEIIFSSKEASFNHIPGQYAFFTFHGENLSPESHPFTLVKTTGERQISILAKARGDFTRLLYQQIRPGNWARIEGPYGRFDCRKGGQSQIWIAGGIGIVPFIAWIRSFKELDLMNRTIDLYYCFHRKNEAILVDEFEQVSQNLPNFRYFLFCSEETNRISAQKIQDSSKGLIKKEVFMCGPKRLTNELCQEFQSLGVPRDNILFEDFEFF